MTWGKSLVGALVSSLMAECEGFQRRRGAALHVSKVGSPASEPGKGQGFHKQDNPARCPDRALLPSSLSRATIHMVGVSRQ